MVLGDTVHSGQSSTGNRRHCYGYTNKWRLLIDYKDRAPPLAACQLQALHSPSARDFRASEANSENVTALYLPELE
jgi:hypothetical protein